MDPRLQRRVQRYGWDLAASDYEALWAEQLAPAQDALLQRAALAPGERVLDVACGTGLVTLAAARRVGAEGHALGVDLSERMVDAACNRGQALGVAQASFRRMDAERLNLPDGDVDVALCALGLMYLPEPEAALRELRRVLRPGGRLVAAVWGERARCGWAPLFEIVDAEVESDVCPLFFRLGQGDMLARLVSDAGFGSIRLQRLGTTLDYADGDAACRAAFAGGPVALAWSRFSAETRARVSRRYLEALDPWRRGDRYRVPAEFVVVAARLPSGSLSTRA
jgi:ubiquinone/menaquinone biosynthesis C-methylase UbiE